MGYNVRHFLMQFNSKWHFLCGCLCGDVLCVKIGKNYIHIAFENFILFDVYHVLHVLQRFFLNDKKSFIAFIDVFTWKIYVPLLN